MVSRVGDQLEGFGLGNQAKALFAAGSEAVDCMMNGGMLNPHTQSWTEVGLEPASVPVLTTGDFVVGILSIRSHHGDSCYLYNG